MFLLVLIDRRFSRELPIQPTYIGKSVDVIDNEYVNVLYHLTYKDLISLYPKYSSDDYFKFTFVRNPYDKLYSTYLYAKKINNEHSIYLILPFILLFVELYLVYPCRFSNDFKI